MTGILTNFWFIQSIGAVALIFVVLAWNAKTRTKILELQSTNLILFIVHYLLLSAYIGAASCVIVLARNFVFVRKDKKTWASHTAWLYVFIILSAGITIIFWKGWITILPALGVIIGTYGMSRDRPAQMRFYMLIACILWIPYTIVVHSYSGILSQLLGVVGILMGMYRHDRKKILLSAE